MDEKTNSQKLFLFGKKPNNTSHLQIMSLPRVADNKPIKVAVEAGKEYYYCTCGLSKNQPW